jgi:LCP family protein required for cell wall assembly
MSRPRLILLATALFLTLSATAGLAAANLPSSVSDGIDTAQQQLLDATQQELHQIVSEVLPNLLPEPVPDGAVPDEAEPDPDGAAQTAPEIIASPGSDKKLVGKDGRFTVLILGSDKRKGIVGERTDTMIVATLDPTNGNVAMVSMPRDTVNVPIANGRVYADRINTLYFSFMSGAGKKNKMAALKKMKQAFAFAYDTEIDHVAMVDFTGLVRLIDEIGGVDVKVKQTLIDPKMHLAKKGLRLKKGERTLDGKTALAFSRSRYTTSDYDRSRRQQAVLAAAVDKIRDSGLSAFPALLHMIRNNVVTDIPLSAAPTLLELAKGASLMSAKNVVLEPGKYARNGSVLYTIQPNIGAVRSMMNKAFGPVKGR